MPRLLTTILNKQGTAHLAVAAGACAVALSIFGIITYEALAAQNAAQAASTALSGKVRRQELVQIAARLADGTKSQRDALSATPIPAGGGPAFIAQVEDLGRKAGAPVQVTAADATPPRQEIPGTLTLTINFQGSYSACIRLSRLLETMQGGVAVTSLALQYDPVKGGWSGTATLGALSFDTP